MTLQSVQSENVCRNVALIKVPNSLADCGFDVQRIDRWMFFDSVLNTLPQIHCMRVIHSGLIFADVQYQQATNPSTD